MLRLRPCKFHLVHLSTIAALILVAVVSLSAQQETRPGNPSHNTTGLVNTTISHENATEFDNSPAQSQQSEKMRVEAGYANLPLSFEQNRGQTDARVRFLSRTGNRTLWLTNDEAVLAVAGTVLRMKFMGANTNAQISGESKQSGVMNYFVGPQAQWRTRIPVYARVRYKSLYPGIDLVFYGNNRQLEYDMVVSPAADPGQIKLAIEGARKIRVDQAGNLVLETPAGEVIQQKPRIYQRHGKALTAVSGHYVINGNDVRIALGSYDRTVAVVIDPVLRYSTILGGSNIDLGHGVVADGSNRAIVAGTACSQDFPATGSSKPPSLGLCSAFVTKFDFTGSRLIFSTLLGNGADGNAVARDSSGNIYVTGDTSGTFPTTSGAFQTTSGGGTDAFVTKLGSGGSTILYSTLLGGSENDFGNGIAVDSAGNAYVTGTTHSTNFPTTAGVFQHDCNLPEIGLCQSAFVTKLNASGSQAFYSTFLGGHGAQNGTGIKVNSAGNAFVSGDTSASDFPTTSGTAQPVFHGETDAFVSKLSASGSHLIYSTFLGGSAFDSAAGIALDSFGNAYVTGLAQSTDFPVKNAFQPHCTITNLGVCGNAFVTKLNSSGQLVYSTFLGGGGDSGSGIAVTPGGQAYVTGFTHSTNFPTTQNSFQRVEGGDTDIFITKYSVGGRIIYSSYLGGGASDLSPAIGLDRGGNAYLTGIVDFESSGTGPAFPTTPGAFQTTPRGAGDAFLAKVVSLCALSTLNRTVTICSPASGSSVASPVRIIAGTTDVTPVKLTQVYLDGKKIYEAFLSAINVALPIAAGTHRLTVQAFDTSNAIFKRSITITVH